MAVDPTEFARRTRLHYRDSFERHGPTPQGVDWNGEASQRRQFDELMRILPAAGPFSVNDFGCGYGALADVLNRICAFVVDHRDAVLSVRIDPLAVLVGGGTECREMAVAIGDVFERSLGR